MIRPPAAEKGAQEIATPRGNVEETRLDGRGKIEARVENIAYRSKQRVHVPDETARCKPCYQDIRVAVKFQHPGGVHPSTKSASLFASGESYQLDGTLVVNCLGQQESNHDSRSRCKSSLQPEDILPWSIGDYYTSCKSLSMALRSHRDNSRTYL